VKESGARLDVVLNRLCLTRSRSEAKTACDAGAVFVDGRPAKPSQPLAPGECVTLRYANRLLELRLIELPAKSISKKAARELYEIVRDEPVAAP
jgi:ribosomal 50S subunit-recycling heat shock protein